MRVVGRGLAALVAACAVVIPASAVQASFAGSADLEAKTIGGHAALGKVAHVTIGIVNHGPGDPEGGTVTLDVTAPTGTVFDAATEASFAECQMPTPHRRVVCKPANKIDFGGGSVSFQLGLKITSNCVTRGRFVVKYAQDPKTSNNASSLTVKVDGADANACAKPTSSPTSSPSLPAKPSASPAAAASPSDDPIPATDSPSAADTPSAEPALLPASSDSGQGGIAGYAFGALAVLAGLAVLAVLFWRARSRRPAEADLDETA